MRVALVGPYPLDAARPEGGVEASFVSLLEGLASFEDIEPHVFTFVPGAPETRRATHGTVPVTYFASPARLNNLILYRPHRRLLAQALSTLDPAIVHAQDAIAHGYIALRAAAEFPVAVSIHGIVREEVKFLTSRYDRARTWLAGPPYQRYCVRHARYLLEPSRYPEEYFGEAISGRIFEVGNPIANRFFAAEAAPEPARLLYAGGVTPGKRVLDLVEMLAAVRRQAPETRLRIAGQTGNLNYVAAVRARSEELGVAEHVELLGALSLDDLVEEYRRASVFVLASGQENSPMVIAEAMAVGVPVVATRVGGVHTLVEEGSTGFLVEVGDIERLAVRVSELLGDDPRRRAFAVAARAAAERRFRSSQVAERVRAVYREMLLGTGSPADGADA